MLKSISLFIFLFIFFPIISYSENIETSGFELKDIATYIGTTDKQIKVTWDIVQEATYYKVRLVSIEREEEILINDHIDVNNIIFQLPKSGHYIVKIQACNDQICSVDSSSDDSQIALVNGEHKGWWLYGYIKKPGSLIFD